MSDFLAFWLKGFFAPYAAAAYAVFALRLWTQRVSRKEWLVLAFFLGHHALQVAQLWLGDGTLNEAVNGAAYAQNAAVGVIPFGSGNDFIRNFDHSALFEDLQSQIDGEPIKVDLLSANGRYALNMINIGFDCEVVMQVDRLRHIPLLKGSLLADLKANPVIRINADAASGLQIGFKDSDVFLDFTDEALCDVICAYVGPKLAAALKG